MKPLEVEDLFDFEQVETSEIIQSLDKRMQERAPTRDATSRFVRAGNVYKIAPTTNQVDVLPVGVYSMGVAMDGFYLEVSEPFPRPHKLYGDTMYVVNRILATYNDRRRNTGVLLGGEKGSGKSLTAKMISIEAAKQGIPTVLINSAYCGEAFNEFLSEIKQQVVVIFDEYEKVYSFKEQQQLLTLLDGVRPSNKLFIFTTNDKGGVEYHLTNRPGRIFYGIKFNGLSQAFIREYLEDVLHDKSRIDATIRVCSMIGTVTFDVLSALVEEMNRYNETAKQALVYMNVDIDKRATKFDGVLTVNGKVIERISPHTFGNPLIWDAESECSVYNMDNKSITDDGDRPCWEFSSAHITDIAPDGVVTLTLPTQGAVLKVSPRKERPDHGINTMLNAYSDL